MLTPNAFLTKKCFVCLNVETSDLSGRLELAPCPAEIVSVKRVLNAFFVQTTLGIFEMSSFLIYDTEEMARRVCQMFNEEEEKGGVSHEQKETSDQG